MTFVYVMASLSIRKYLPVLFFTLAYHATL